MIETTRHHPDRSSAIDSVNDQVARAVASRRFCVISVYIDENNQAIYNDTTLEFPMGDFDAVLRMAKISFDRQRGLDAPPPLPIADHILHRTKTPIESAGSVSANQTKELAPDPGPCQTC